MTSGVVCSGSTFLGQLSIKQAAPTLCAAEQSRSPGWPCPRTGVLSRPFGSALLPRDDLSSAAVLAAGAAPLKQEATPAGHGKARGRRGRRPQFECRQEVWGPAVTTSPSEEVGRVFLPAVAIPCAYSE